MPLQVAPMSDGAHSHLRVVQRLALRIHDHAADNDCTAKLEHMLSVQEESLDIGVTAHRNVFASHMFRMTRAAFDRFDCFGGDPLDAPAAIGATICCSQPSFH